MILLNELERFIFSRLPEEMPILLEHNRLLTPMCFDNFEQADKVEEEDFFQFYEITNPLDPKAVEILLEGDMELFSQDLWEDNYISKTYYVKDWISCNFPLLEKRYGNNISGGGLRIGFVPRTEFIKATRSNELWTIKDQKQKNQKMENKRIIFPFLDSGVDYYFTYLNGIGVNNCPIFNGNKKINVGEALIFNTTPIPSKNLRDGDDYICDFSLYQINQIRHPKKPSPNLFHSLINERRKTNEK